MSAAVVVGVDGSTGSVAALEWAARYAEQVDAKLTAVIAWHPPASPGWSLDTSDWPQVAGECLQAVVEPVEKQHPTVTIERLVEEGPTAQVLLGAARTADLLVVGSRGHGAFAGMLLGSVSMHCVHHARCPVVVVPPETA